MDKKIIAQVQKKIKESLNNYYNIKINKPNHPKFIAGNSHFPDVLLYNKKTGNLQFVVEIKHNYEVAENIEEIRKLATLPITVYLIVPGEELESIKRIILQANLSVRFGLFTSNKDKIKIQYYT